MKYLFNRRTWETPNRSIWEPVTAKKCDNLFTSTLIEPRPEPALFELEFHERSRN